MEVDKSTKIPVEHESGAQSGSDIVVGEMIDAEEGISKDNNASSDLSAAVQAYVPDTKEEKQLVRKVDIMLMPMLWVMCVLCYVDRNNISNAAAAGMNTDLKLTDNNYSMLISIFFIGYIIWEIPSNLLISRLRPSLYLPALMVAWGALVAGMSQLKNYHSILICRFFLGIIECGFFPGVLYLLTCWYKKSEVGKLNAQEIQNEPKVTISTNGPRKAILYLLYCTLFLRCRKWTHCRRSYDWPRRQTRNGWLEMAVSHRRHHNRWRCRSCSICHPGLPALESPP